MTSRCIGTPISWLRLEQYLLGELPADVHRAVQQHLDDCAACKSCVEFAQRERLARPSVGANDPLRDPRKPAPAETESLPFRRRTLPRRWAVIALSTAAIVGAAMLAFRPTLGGDEVSIPARRAAIKGGELAIGLIRERAGTKTLD